MSYSFSGRVANRTLAREAIKVEWDKVVEHQPIHAKDRPAAEAMANAFLDLMDEEREDHALAYGCNGGVGYTEDTSKPLLSVSGAAQFHWVRM